MRHILSLELCNRLQNLTDLKIKGFDLKVATDCINIFIPLLSPFKLIAPFLIPVSYIPIPYF